MSLHVEEGGERAKLCTNTPETEAIPRDRPTPISVCPAQFCSPQTVSPSVIWPCLHKIHECAWKGYPFCCFCFPFSFKRTCFSLCPLWCLVLPYKFAWCHVLFVIWFAWKCCHGMVKFAFCMVGVCMMWMLCMESCFGVVWVCMRVVCRELVSYTWKWFYLLEALHGVSFSSFACSILAWE